MSNLIKSGFVAFSQDDTLVIDANRNKIIQAIDSTMEEVAVSEEETMEEALAEVLIRDAELEGMDFGEDTLTLDPAAIPKGDGISEDLSVIADDMIRSAKAEAESIIAQAHDEAEQLRATAYDEAESIERNAKEEGYRSGYQEAIEKAEEELRVKREELEKRQEEIERYLQENEKNLIETTEQKMVELLCQYIPAITGVMVDGQKDVLFYLINRAMRDLDNSKSFVIKVSSQDYANIEERKNEIYGALNPNIDMEIFEDSKLSSMQCIIETDNGIVDVSLDVQLDNLITALKLLAKV